ncbi:MAG: PAS domain-containing protein, partial [Actinobacteria bacterium]|nr:PAS domain-containing protein [Actinomycetota bacterium]
IVEPLPLAEGELIWIQTTKVPLHDHNGQPYAVLGIFEDVTERKRAEADILRLNEELAQSNRSLEEATRAKSDFLASMSHELRTPLNSIIGFSGVLAQEIPGELNAEQHKQLGMINRSGRHLLLLVNEILDLVRIESGQKNPTIRDVDISELVAEMFNTMEPLAAAKGLQVNLVRPEEPLRAITDPHFMSQIMLNLLGNAVKFTDVGHVTTTVSREGTDLLISVQDSGCGIAAENTARIFDDFYQAAASDGVKHEGTGLGLAVSRRLAESIGVQIDVVSELGKGSTFTVRIPDTVPK